MKLLRRMCADLARTLAVRRVLALFERNRRRSTPTCPIPRAVPFHQLHKTHGLVEFLTFCASEVLALHERDGHWRWLRAGGRASGRADIWNRIICEARARALVCLFYAQKSGSGLLSYWPIA